MVSKTHLKRLLEDSPLGGSETDKEGEVLSRFEGIECVEQHKRTAGVQNRRGQVYFFVCSMEINKEQ